MPYCAPSYGGSPSALAKWGVSPDAVVVASSGDNPCAIAGLGLSQPGDLALSLGTSDTLLGVAPEATGAMLADGLSKQLPTKSHDALVQELFGDCVDGSAKSDDLETRRCTAFALNNVASNEQNHRVLERMGVLRPLIVLIRDRDQDTSVL